MDSSCHVSTTRWCCLPHFHGHSVKSAAWMWGFFCLAPKRHHTPSKKHHTPWAHLYILYISKPWFTRSHLPCVSELQTQTCLCLSLTPALTFLMMSLGFLIIKNTQLIVTFSENSWLYGLSTALEWDLYTLPFWCKVIVRGMYTLAWLLKPSGLCRISRLTHNFYGETWPYWRDRKWWLLLIIGPADVTHTWAALTALSLTLPPTYSPPVIPFQSTSHFSFSILLTHICVHTHTHTCPVYSNMNSPLSDVVFVFLTLHQYGCSSRVAGGQCSSQCMFLMPEQKENYFINKLSNTYCLKTEFENC